MQALFSSETSVDFHRTIRFYISEDTTLHGHRYVNLKSNFFIFVCIYFQNITFAILVIRKLLLI
jgi:hypothetical protein